MLTILGEFCETELKSHCDEGYYVDPSVGLCGPCTCPIHDNFNQVCDKDGKQEPGSYAGKCFCKVRALLQLCESDKFVQITYH